MTVKELQEILKIRQQSGNPTEKSLMFVLSQKLDELEKENKELKRRLENADVN